MSALAGLVSSLVVPGGVAFQLLDPAVLGPDGRAVTRARGISRAAIAWIPALLSLALFVYCPPAGASAVETGWLSLVLLALFVAGGLLALIDPRRGLQDRIAGTSPVPEMRSVIIWLEGIVGGIPPPAAPGVESIPVTSSASSWRSVPSATGIGLAGTGDVLQRTRASRRTPR